MSRRSIICLSLRLRQIIDQLATDKLRYFAQPRPIIVNYTHCIFLYKTLRNGSLCFSWHIPWLSTQHNILNFFTLFQDVSLDYIEQLTGFTQIYVAFLLLTIWARTLVTQKCFPIRKRVKNWKRVQEIKRTQMICIKWPVFNWTTVVLVESSRFLDETESVIASKFRNVFLVSGIVSNFYADLFSGDRTKTVV